MRKSAIVVLLCACLTAVVALTVAGLTGCGNPQRSMFCKTDRPQYLLELRRAEPTAAMAHGGQATVNAAAYDAMFFKHYGVNPAIDTDEDNLSTFAMDVDTGSYTVCRRYLQDNNVPPEEAVRVEEFINYFGYNYAPPETPNEDFAIHLAAAPSQFGKGRTLLRVGLKAREVQAADRKPAVLTFVIDVSGSMSREDRLGTVKKALRMLVGELRDTDRIGIAVFGSKGRKVLDHHSVKDRKTILSAIDKLECEGSTNADEGLRIGYEMAEEAFDAEATNRVILCSDGVANMGDTSAKALLKNIRKHVDRGIMLTTLGFGMGNYNDVLMEQLADTGNGNYAYIDSIAEARRIFVEELTSTLQLVAREAKVQVEFDPAVVRSYRLLGYENRDVADEDFRNDKVDGGEVGAGHSVTALYELKLQSDARADGVLATVRIRWKLADADEVREIDRRITVQETAGRFDAAPADVQLAACVAEFAEILRKSHWAKGSSMSDVLQTARACSRAFDKRADVEEFISLVRTADKLIKVDDRPADAEEELAMMND